MGSRWWDFGGDTIVRADQYIRLASDRPSQSGWLFSRAPLSATNWEIEVEFSIHGAGNLHGDGFAMWITKDRATPGPVFGHKDEFEGLAIFFDTYKNNRPGVVFPYVMAMMGDGRTKYDQTNDGKANEIGGCSVSPTTNGWAVNNLLQARGLRGANIPTKAKLTYFQDKSLSLQLQYKTDDRWSLCFSLEPSASLALKLPNVVYLGFSAETGELSDNFDIISVETRNLYSLGGSSGDPGSKQESSRKKSGRGRRERESGGWGWFFFKLIMFAGLLVGGYVGWTMYRTSKRTRF